MKNCRLSIRDGTRRACLRWTLPWLLLTLFSLNSRAGNGGNASPTSGGATNASSPADDVTSLPIVHDDSGLTLVGTLRELRALEISLDGNGRVEVQRVGRHTFALTLVGDYRVELDRAALARSDALVLFRGGAPFQDGLAILQVGSSTPVFLAPDRVLLPLGRLAASPRAHGRLLTLDAYGPRGRHTHVEGSFASDRVVLTQRAN